MQGFRPLDDLIIIQRDEPESETSWGLIIPPVAQEELDQGTIIAAGPGKRTPKAIVPLDVKVGDKVLYSRFANLKFNLDGKEYVTMREADIIGVIE
jgi:chaperonin GroES